MYQVLQEASEHEASESQNWSTATRNIAGGGEWNFDKKNERK